MKTIPQYREALDKVRRQHHIQATYNSYVAIRRDYCHGMATLQELAHALALIQNEVES